MTVCLRQESSSFLFCLSVPINGALSYRVSAEGLHSEMSNLEVLLPCCSTISGVLSSTLCVLDESQPCQWEGEMGEWCSLHFHISLKLQCRSCTLHFARTYPCFCKENQKIQRIFWIASCPAKHFVAVEEREDSYWGAINDHCQKVFH